MRFFLRIFHSFHRITARCPLMEILWSTRAKKREEMLARHKFERVTMPERRIWLGLALSAVAMLAGCASGGSGGGGTTTTTTTSTGPDMGTMVNVNDSVYDSNQYRSEEHTSELQSL